MREYSQYNISNNVQFADLSPLPQNVTLLFSPDFDNYQPPQKVKYFNQINLLK